MNHKDKYGTEYSDPIYTDNILRYFPSLTPKFDGIYSKKNDIVLSVETFSTDWKMENSADVIVFRLETLIDFMINLFGEVNFNKGYSSYCVSYKAKEVTYSLYSDSIVDVVAKALISRYENTVSKEVRKFT